MSRLSCRFALTAFLACVLVIVCPPHPLATLYLLRLHLQVGLYQSGLGGNGYSIAGRILKPQSDAVPNKPPPGTGVSSSPLEPEPNEKIEEGKANAVILMLARNRELAGAMSSMRQLEEKFNHQFKYPWVFLNEEPFTEEFKK
jgi:hypothetical protein